MKVNAELMEAIDRHMKWRTHRPGGECFVWDKYSHLKDEVGESFVGAMLTGANFSRANCRGINFCGASLADANFGGADLEGANLWRTCMTEANLCKASLYKANLCETEFFRANLSRAVLMDTTCIKTLFNESTLYSADLSGAIFEEALLNDANLQKADLSNAVFFNSDLRGTNFSNTDLSTTKFDSIFYNTTISYLALVCPEKGSYIGFKSAGGRIVELEIPADALRSSATSRQCRASKAKVLSITYFNGRPNDVDFVASNYDEDFIYKVGETVEVKDFDTNRWHESSTGIHHFITRGEAVNYVP